MIFTIKEISDLLRVSPQTVLREIKAGELAAIKVGKRYKVEDADLEKYKEKRKTNAPL